ncbi:hypothetical protein [Agromyces sp. GXQ0307]|uniref:hypothetical protein n=1 Tax=Agromyces sp. GXQ0307 TaxID=3377835 RepID=UPI003839F432
MELRADSAGHWRNPAGRLYLWFDYALAINPNARDRFETRHVFRKFLEGHIERRDDDEISISSPKFYDAVAELLRLPDEMHLQVVTMSNAPIPKDTLLEALPRVRECLDLFGAKPSKPLSEFTRYDQATTKSLNIASHILNNSAPYQPPIPETQLEGVRDAAEGLVAMIAQDSQLDDELRRVLYHHAKAVLDAVDLYQVSGIEAVLAEFDKLIGVLQRRPDLRRKVKESAVAEKVAGLLMALNIVAGLGNAAVAVEAGASSVVELLELSPLDSGDVATPP